MVDFQIDSQKRAHIYLPRQVFEMEAAKKVLLFHFSKLKDSCKKFSARLSTKRQPMKVLEEVLNFEKLSQIEVKQNKTKRGLFIE